MGVVIAWEEPPSAVRNAPRSIWCRAAKELHDRPGEWALVVSDETSAYARDSAARMLRRYGCEVKTRKTTDDGRISVWARWPVEKPHTPSQRASGVIPSSACTEHTFHVEPAR